MADASFRVSVSPDVLSYSIARACLEALVVHGRENVIIHGSDVADVASQALAAMDRFEHGGAAS